MRAQCIYLFIISGICLGLLLAYPIQDGSSTGGVNQGYNVVTNIESEASEQSSNPLLTSSRLDRLVGTYMNLVRAELGTKLRKMADFADKDDATEDPDNTMFLSKVVPASSGTFKGNADTISPSVSNNEYGDFGSEKSKRHQQTWYIPYGKRKANLLSTDNIPQHLTKGGLDNNDQVKYNENEARRLLSSQLGKHKYTSMSDVALLSRILDDFNMVSASDNKERNGEARNWNLESVDKTDRRQAHPSWVTNYGKRTPDEYLLHVL